MNDSNINTDHIIRLTDDTGIYQHSVYSVPNPLKGYTTDDNARALIAAAMLYEKYKSQEYLDLIYRYMSFLLYAQNSDGRFRNFMNYKREFLEEVGSEDCFGRCLWATGYILNTSLHYGIKNAARYLVNNSLPNTADLVSLRGKAYSIIGLCLIHKSKNKEIDNDKVLRFITKLSDDIVKQFDTHNDGNWQWFENALTYGNAVIPWAILKSYNIVKKDEYLKTAVESMNFLSKICFKKGFFKPIGCHGWFKKGTDKIAEFDEQPLEACESALMYLEAYHSFNDKKYLELANRCNNWFLGENSKNICLVDNQTGGCYDGITKSGVNMNEGAESIISRIITHMIIKDDKLAF